MSRPECPGLNLSENSPHTLGVCQTKNFCCDGGTRRGKMTVSHFPGLFPKVSAMATRLIFLAVVCVGSLAFGQEQAANAAATTPIYTPYDPAATPTYTEGAHKTAASALAAASGTPAPKAPKTPAFGTPLTDAPRTPAPWTPTTPYLTPAPVPPTPITPAPLLSGLVPATPAAPMGFTMHFHIGGNFDASFDMNVSEGQAKQKESPAKKRRGDAARRPQRHAKPIAHIRSPKHQRSESRLPKPVLRMPEKDGWLPLSKCRRSLRPP